MILYFLKKFMRNALRHRQIVVINILCLSLGFAAFIILMRYVNYETTWDKENPNYKRIFCVNKIVKYQNDEKEFTRNHYPLAKELKKELPEIEESVIIKPLWDEYLSVDGNNVVLEKKGFYASNNVFTIFPYKILDGDKSNMLIAPNSMVITKSLAKKLFPDQNPIGKTLFNGQKSVYTITGLIDDVPENRQVQPTYLISAITDEKNLNVGENWDKHSNYFVYILLKQNVDIKLMEDKINAVFWKHKDKARESLYLQPLSKLHLEVTRKSDEKYVPIYYSILAFLILLLACVNFMNLQNISSGYRSKEIGILKLSGSNRSNLVIQFLGESALLSFLALLGASILVMLGLPVFNQIVERSITISFSHNLTFYFWIFGITLATGILSGLYPAFVLSSYKPVQVLKTDANIFKNSKSLGQRVVVLFQFFLAACLISVSVWMYHQVNYMKNKNLGYDTNNLILCTIPDNSSTLDFDNLRSELLNNPLISNATISQSIPLHSNWTGEIYDEARQTDEEIFTSFNRVSHDFIETYGMKITGGRNFSKELITDNKSCIINETCVKTFGWSNPIGKSIHAVGNSYTVIGVVADFHQSSIHDRINPYFMILNNGKLNKELFLTIKTSGNPASAVAFINTTIKSNINEILFNIEDFNTTIDDAGIRIWKSVEKIFLFFALLAIGIALFGLYALVSISTKCRTKEIGIRKVQGSSVLQVFYLINKNYLILLALALSIALPISNIVASVAPGAYKYKVQWFDYLFVIIAIYSIAILTSGWISYKAASRNPVEALRYE